MFPTNQPYVGLRAAGVRRYPTTEWLSAFCSTSTQKGEEADRTTRLGLSCDEQPRGLMDLDQLSAGLEVLGSLDPGALPLHHAQVFLFIAEQGSCTYRDIEKRFGISNASASRIVNSLGEFSGHRKSPLGLISVGIDPGEGRRYRVRLTKKGEAVIRSIKAI